MVFSVLLRKLANILEYCYSLQNKDTDCARHLASFLLLYLICKPFYLCINGSRNCSLCDH